MPDDAPLTPRNLARAAAAAYVGLPLSTFDDQVAKGILPAPLRFNRRVVWDRAALDQALDRLSGLAPRFAPSFVDADAEAEAIRRIRDRARGFPQREPGQEAAR